MEEKEDSDVVEAEQKIEQADTGLDKEIVEISDEEGDQPQLRRSTRIKTPPEYLSDYILQAETECEWLLITINNEPWDFDMKVWLDACRDEIASIEKNQT